MEKLTEMSFNGLHNHIFKNFIQNKIKKNAKILILGSGKGAFEQRLLGYGYNNLYSVDFYTEFKLKDKVKFMKQDLNEAFGKKIEAEFKIKFDLIVSIEIIEHTYSIYNFLQNARDLLNKEGVLIISTPNPHSYLARIDNLLTGFPTFYITKPDIGDHVSPVFDNVLVHFSNQLELKIITRDYFGKFFDYLKSYQKSSFRSYIYLFMLICLYLVLNPLMVVNRKFGRGMTMIYLIKKK